MSVMEKRLQILLDHARYSRLEAEATRSGRSVAAVIREAIDLRFPSDTTEVQAAAARFLASTERGPGAGTSWAETKSVMDDELASKLAR